MTEYRIHYVISGYRSGGAARCGRTPRSFTTIPAKVTCKTCKKLLKGEVK